MTGFSALGISEEVLKALEQKGFENPTPIQELTIPLLLNSTNDIVGQAQTGTGKTAAFGIPIIERFDPNDRNVQALILTPTRELALQVCEEIKSYRGSKKISICAVYGGSSIMMQIKDLERGAHIVVGTPGRVIDLIDRRKLKLGNVKFMVLDEADEMLNMGFIDDVEKIVKETPEERRMLMFSATMPDRILSLAKRHMGKFDLISVKKEELTNTSIEQTYYEVPNRDKFDALCRIIDMETDIYGIVFCNTKVEVTEMTLRLNERGYSADCIHGDVVQSQREKVIRQFKSNQKGILVATDVAARGIDVSDLTHVINYSLPQDPESYVHRIGRTGRAGKLGKAISLVPADERRKLLFISRISNAPIKKAYLPDATDMIRIKKERIKNNLLSILTSEKHFEYGTFALELLEIAEPQEVLAALLRLSFKNELDPKGYKNLAQDTHNEDRNSRGVSARGDRRNDDRGDRRHDDRGDDRRHDDRDNRNMLAGGKQRLFLAKGKQDGFNPRKVLDLIFEESQVDGRFIDDIKILDNFTFFTTKSREADIILDAFRKHGKGRKSLVELAKPARN